MEVSHMFSRFLTAALLASLSLSFTAAVADEHAPAADRKADVVPEARTWVTRHKARIGGQVIAYTVTAGTLLMKNDDDEPVALFGFTAYVKDGEDPTNRPLMFAYNGGPGSASAWLHMGILGPKRTVLEDLASNTAGPFRTVENEYSILDHADLVMIDPVGTGFSQIVGKGDKKDFYGVDQDIDSVSRFIVRFLGDYGRWASPKFVLGESYGGIRTAGVAHELLSRHNVALNGIILVSPYLDYGSGNAGVKLDVPYVNFLTTYAATAWYHRVLKDRPDDLQAFLREAESFAEEVYAPVLFKGARATTEERAQVLAGLERYTGVSQEFWDLANLRLDEGRFLQELMRRQGKVVGRIDTRYVGDIIGPLGEYTDYDPYSAQVAPAIVATFNDYYRRELGVQTERSYVLSGRLWRDWDQSHAQPDQRGKVPFPNTVVDLSHAMILNPRMKVLIQQGYYDLACPYGTVEYAVDHLDVSPALRENVSIAYYEAGHMMYVHGPSMVKFRDDLAAFVEANRR
ncbi:MAG: S10 family peptidase [Steroidobacteraceae bacterium]